MSQFIATDTILLGATDTRPHRSLLVISATTDSITIQEVSNVYTKPLQAFYAELQRHKDEGRSLFLSRIKK